MVELKQVKSGGSSMPTVLSLSTMTMVRMINAVAIYVPQPNQHKKLESPN